MAKLAGNWLRGGLVVAVFWGVGFWAEESNAQLLRGRSGRSSGQIAQPSNRGGQASNPGWRGVQTQEVGGEPISGLPIESSPASSGLGAVIRPVDGNPLPALGPGAEEIGRPGTRVPEHYYRQDWRRDPAARGGTANYPKYFGGFHSSHYYDLGIPNGDKGLRGNGIYWTPW